LIHGYCSWVKHNHSFLNKKSLPCRDERISWYHPASQALA
jgi:hypothetical protein